MPKKIYPESKKKNSNPLVKEVWESKIKQSPSKNKHISYSAISTYQKCPLAWQLLYKDKVVPFEQNIYLCFGTAMHETMQEWLTVMYHDKVKAANDIDLGKLLYANMVKAYKIGLAQSKKGHFSTQDQMTEFWLDGKHILEYLTKKRGGYFSTKTMMLAGVETLLYQDIRPGVKFKGSIDLVFYHPNTDRWTIMDIKTSTRGWNNDQKKNPKLTAQVVLYKEFFSKQFGVDKDNIDVEYFIVKRRIPAEAEFASMQKRVQTFSPPSGPRKTKEVLNAMNLFMEEVLDEEDNYIDKEYNCNNPFGKCNECSKFL